MDLQAMKLELVKEILNSESKDLINLLLQTLKKEDKSYQRDVTDAQLREVQLGLSQIQSGETEDWDGFLRRVA